MNIAEIRSAVAADFEKTNPRNGGFPSAPDWVVRRLYERRNGLLVTPLPSGIAVRSLRSLLTAAPRKSALSTPAVAVDDDPNGEKEKLRLMTEALKLL